MRKYAKVLSSGMLIAGLSLWTMPAEASVLGGIKKVGKFVVAAPIAVVGVTTGAIAIGCGIGLSIIYRDELDQTFAGKMSAKFTHK